MRIVVLALALLVLAGCGASRTPADEAFLAEMQEQGSSIKLEDPDGVLAGGHAVCDGLAKIKPEDRTFIRYGLQRNPAVGYAMVTAATTHLCPDMAKLY